MSPPGARSVFLPLPPLLSWLGAGTQPATAHDARGTWGAPGAAYLGFLGTAARASASTRTGFAAGRWGTAARRQRWLRAPEGRG